MNIGERIRYFRKIKNLTGNQLSEMTNIAQSLISRYETGQVEPPVSTLINICDALGITLAEFFADDQQELPPELRQLLNIAKNLTPEQVEALQNFLKSFIK